MKFIGIIPARYASSRFPGKPLAIIEGKSMIQRVYEQAQKSTSLSEIIVATDDIRIAEAVASFGGKYKMTSTSHESGTDRCAEVMTSFPDFDVAINIQGDEPFINPAQIDLLAACFKDQTTEIATLVKEIHSEEELFNTNIPKVVRNIKDEAIYFSRQTIPFLRNERQENWLKAHQYYKHIGIYAYKTAILQQLTALPISILEKAEALEQLRWVEQGYKIKTAVTTHETIAVDTPDDLKRILKTFFDK